MNESNLWSLSATELRHAYMKRTLSPVEVLESYLGRITKLNPKVIFNLYYKVVSVLIKIYLDFKISKMHLFIMGFRLRKINLKLQKLLILLNLINS